MSKPKISDRQKIAALSFAIDAARDMHGSVVGNPRESHAIDAVGCKCAYGETIRALAIIRSEAYKALQKDKAQRDQKLCTVLA